MARGNNKNKVFRKDEDFEYYLSLIKKYKDKMPFDLFHYCLMPTHVHKLIRTRNAEDFSVYMKKINLAYFHYYRRKYGWVGHFWQGRFKSQPVGKDEYFIQCGKYIELNPVRKGFANDPKDYQYSSYGYYSTGRDDPLLTTDIFYETLGNNLTDRQKAYRDLVIDDSILSSYSKKSWGSKDQRHNETRKIQHHLSKKYQA